MGTQSKKRSPSWIPSKESKSYKISLYDDKPALIVKYLPEPAIKELNKLFTFFYLQGIGIKAPLKLLVEPDSPLSGLLTAWYALGAQFVQTNVAKRRAATAEEIEKALETVGSAEDAENAAKLKEFQERLQSNHDELSGFTYGVGRWTVLATDYIAEHLPEKIQSALVQLMMEAEVHAFYAGAEEKGVKPVNTKHERDMVDTILRTEEKMIKRRLNTRRPGGRPRTYDFSRLNEFYEQGKELFRKAKRTLKTLEHLPRKDQHDSLNKAYPQIDADLIDRMLGREAYLSMPSRLAIEWAGRHCGLSADRPEEEYPTTYLLQICSGKKK